MTDQTQRKPNKLGAASLATNAVIIFLIWLVFFWAGGVNALGGVNGVHGFLIRFTAAIPAALIIAANIAVARQLWAGGFKEKQY